MIKYGVFCLLIQNISSSSDSDVKKLIKKLKDTQKWNDVSVYIHNKKWRN